MPVVQPTRASHTTLEVGDLARALRFYEEVLGLETHLATPTTGHLRATNGQYAAVHGRHRPAPQPFLNFYARPVADAAAVDEAHARISAVRDQWAIRELTPPAREDPAKFGVGTYGFYLHDADRNWWRIEENDGPFGPQAIPPDAAPRGAIVPAGPISYVMLECRRLEPTMRFLGDYLGLEVRRGGPTCAYAGGYGGVNVIAVEVGDRLSPQRRSNHHGVMLAAGEATIDALHAATGAVKEQFGIQRLQKPVYAHGSYSFYLEDQDTNWWEVEIWEDGVSPWDRAAARLAV
ncbi:MAG TPA: VOC family protein [Chloroflexota bacterium]|jgi:catechol 2,3-dioxygenase-like lactoylglutathione lyase family enzyme